MKKIAILTISICLFTACSGTRGDVRLTSEPSIERAFDILNETSLGKQLIKFLQQNPVFFEYSKSPGLCHRFSLEKGLIFVPAEVKGSDLMLALTVARAAYIYRLHTLTGLENIISEEEELASLFQARVGLQINLVSEDFSKSEHSSELKNYFCTYIMDQSEYTMAKARKEALDKNPDCQRPLETLAVQQLWLAELQQAVNDNTFHQLLYTRDLRRVRNGIITMNEAMKNDARIRGMPAYDLYRFQEFFYNHQKNIISNFVKAYTRELIEDKTWRQTHKADLDRARASFSDCNMPI